MKFLKRTTRKQLPLLLLISLIGIVLIWTIILFVGFILKPNEEADFKHNKVTIDKNDIPGVHQQSGIIEKRSGRSGCKAESYTSFTTAPTTTGCVQTAVSGFFGDNILGFINTVLFFTSGGGQFCNKFSIAS